MEAPSTLSSLFFLFFTHLNYYTFETMCFPTEISSKASHPVAYPQLKLKGKKKLIPFEKDTFLRKSLSIAIATV